MEAVHACFVCGGAMRLTCCGPAEAEGGEGPQGSGLWEHAGEAKHNRWLLARTESQLSKATLDPGACVFLLSCDGVHAAIALLPGSGVHLGTEGTHFAPWARLALQTGIRPQGAGYWQFPVDDAAWDGLPHPGNSEEVLREFTTARPSRYCSPLRTYPTFCRRVCERLTHSLRGSARPARSPDERRATNVSSRRPVTQFYLWRDETDG